MKKFIIFLISINYMFVFSQIRSSSFHGDYLYFGKLNKKIEHTTGLDMKRLKWLCHWQKVCIFYML